MVVSTLASKYCGILDCPHILVITEYHDGNLTSFQYEGFDCSKAGLLEEKSFQQGKKLGLTGCERSREHGKEE